MESCWLSPEGKIYKCCFHKDEAENIVEELGLWEEFWEHPENFGYSVVEFLEYRGWVKYSDIEDFRGWCILPYTTLTKAQIDKIYELTGEFYGKDP